MTAHIDFLLNDRRVRATEPPGVLVLDWLRQQQRLVGTKEGCKEGDCGACSVLVGAWDGVRVTYKPITSCLTPLGELHGRHLVTIEGLNLPGEGLNPVQEAMVAHGGSQCGFCTPGFVVSMCWYLLQSPQAAPDLEGLRRAISGNLCRCTGYGAISRASQALVDAFAPQGPLGGVWAAPDRADALARHGLLPAWWSDVPARMASLHQELAAHAPPDAPAFFIAGGTDLYVQRGDDLPEAQVEVLNRRDDLTSWVRLEGDTLRVGALTTFEDFANHPDILRFLPSMREDMALIASLPIRNRATLAGNLVNASPIGDMTICLLALGAALTWRAPDGATREAPLRDLYLGYKRLDRAPGELITEIAFPALDARTGFSFEKVSKRRSLDIATVNAAARLTVDAQGQILDAGLALGGVAPVPLFLRQTSAWLVGQTLDVDTCRGALERLDAEISPISDVRGSAAYKRLLARRLTAAHFLKLAPGRVDAAALLGASFAQEETV